MITFNPHKGNRPVFKAPTFYDTQRFKKFWERYPEKQDTVFSSQSMYRQSRDFFGGHSDVMIFRSSAAMPFFIAPRGISIDNIVFLSYKPIISFTILSAPFTNPVRTSMLKMSCPRYFQAIVTAERELSSAGEELDKKAE